MDKLPASVDGNWLAVIEASANSRCKFKFEPALGAFVLESLLPTGTSFPYAFGFVPCTLGDDGDPLDVVVLTDEVPPVDTVILSSHSAGKVARRPSPISKRVANRFATSSTADAPDTALMSSSAYERQRGPCRVHAR